jgi:ribonuclease HI
VVAEIIKGSKRVETLNHVGLAELILTARWYMWWERRKLTHGDTVQNLARSVVPIATLASNYQRAAKKTTKVRVGRIKPPENSLMLNVDASYNKDRSTGSTGAVIRDSNGHFIAADAKYFEHVLDAPMAEALAHREGLGLASQVGCNRLMVQTDCMEVVETMKQQGMSATASGPIYEECVQVWQDFASISIDRVHREANTVAHDIAREAMVSKSSCSWVDEPSSIILEALVNDVTLFRE